MLERDERHQHVPEEGHDPMLVAPGRTRPGEPCAPARSGTCAGRLHLVLREDN